MFKIDSDPKFWTKVHVVLPGEDSQDFNAQFKVRPASSVTEVDFSNADDTADFLMEILEDVSDVIGEDGNKAAFSTSLAKQLVDMPHIRSALFKAYAAGIAGASLGN